MNAVIRQELMHDPRAEPSIQMAVEGNRNGAIYRLEGAAPSTPDRLDALQQVLEVARERGLRSAIVSWNCRSPFTEDFILPAVSTLLSAPSRGLRIGLVSHCVSDDRLLETLAIECIVNGLNVQHFQDIERATRWARFL